MPPKRGDDAPVRGDLKDVAQLAGVSVGTVSRVINGNPSVAEELRTRVHEAIEALDYRPNVLARSLRRQESQTIGLLVPDITNPFFSELAKYVELAAAERDWVVLLGNSMNSAQVETRYLNSFMARQADGLIVVPSEQTTDLRAAAEVATVVVDRRVDGVDFVGSDHQGGARQAIEYLIELGHQRIGCIAGPRELASSYERYQGFTDVMTTRLGMTKRSLGPLTRFADFDTAGGRSAARELLSLPQPPTALFAASDQQAVGALNEAVDRGVRVPQDLSVVGFDDIPLARLWSPRLTTVAQPIAEIGARAVEMLLERRQHSGAPRSDVLATQLQIRESAQGP